MPRMGRHATLPIGSNIIWHNGIAPNSAYGATGLAENPFSRMNFLVRDFRGNTALAFNFETPKQNHSWNVANIPTSDKYRNVALRATACARLAEQFWSELFLDMNTRSPEYRLIDSITVEYINGLHSQFTQRLQSGQILSFRPRKASAKN